jgi:DNA-directed RNA polymerase subunit RPC12/RpoP
MKTWNWKCMRCGHDYTEPYDPKAAQSERSCPKCRSNSVRPLAEEGAGKK